MNQELFYKRYRKFDETEETIKLCINTILQFENFLNYEVEKSSIDDIKRYSKYLIDHNTNTYNNFIHLARYYYYIDYKEHYIHMTKYFNTHGVLENIINRVSLYESKEKKDSIIKDMKLPKFGTESLDLPNETARFMEVLNKHLDKKNM